MEIYQVFGDDISLTGNGNILMVQGDQETYQRLTRRLCTEPGQYLWELSYGTGLQEFIGQPLSTANVKAITGRIRRSMYMEQTVARSPEPVINLTASGNNLNCNIEYVSVTSGKLYTLSFTVN
jgi:hypothetical protein